MRSLTDEILGQLQPLRLFWHVVMHVIVGGTYLYVQLTPSEGLLCLVPLAGVLVVLDVARMFIPKWNAFCIKHYAGFMRDTEKSFVSAMTMTIVAMCLVVWLFPREIAASAILFAGLIDPAARFFGVLYGKVRIENLKKTYAGLAGGVVAGVLLAWGLSAHMMHVATKLTFEVLSLGVISASTIELLAGRLDNLLIPLGSAGAMALVL